MFGLLDPHLPWCLFWLMMGCLVPIDPFCQCGERRFLWVGVFVLLSALVSALASVLLCCLFVGFGCCCWPLGPDCISFQKKKKRSGEHMKV